MLLLQILYITAGFIAIAAGFPQMKRLIEVKNSDEFSLQTWVMWALTQMITLLYASTLGDWLIVTVSGAWVAFYITMVTLIIYYRPKPAEAIVDNDL